MSSDQKNEACDPALDLPEEDSEPSLSAKILTVSDGVAAGVREDRSGLVLLEVLQAHGYQIAEQRLSPDGLEAVSGVLSEMAQDFAGLIVTTGGTGFTPRDLTPEATKAVIDREAPGLAEAMRLVNPLGRLSRAVAGTCGQALIVNTPGSPKGAQECIEAILDILPHALKLLAGQPTSH